MGNHYGANDGSARWLCRPRVSALNIDFSGAAGSATPVQWLQLETASQRSITICPYWIPVPVNPLWLKSQSSGATQRSVPRWRISVSRQRRQSHEASTNPCLCKDLLNMKKKWTSHKMTLSPSPIGRTARRVGHVEALRLGEHNSGDKAIMR